MANREQMEKQSDAGRETPPRPSSVRERAPTERESEQQTEIDNELTMVESITDRLRESYRSKLPDAKSALSKEQRIQLAELFNDKADLASVMDDAGSDTLSAAEAKLDIYYKIMSIVDDASREVQGKKEDLARSRAEATPKGGEMYSPESDVTAVEKDEDTNFIKDMGAVNEQRATAAAEKAAQPEEVVEKDPVDEQKEAAEAWDAQVGQWITWAAENHMYNMNTGEKPWNPELTSEDLMEKTGLNQQQLFGLTSAMIRRKQQAEKNYKQAA